MKTFDLVLILVLAGPWGLTTAGCDDGPGGGMLQLARQVAPVRAGSDTPLSYAEENGRFLYTRYCEACHGPQGNGQGVNAPNLDPKPRDFTDRGQMQGRSDGDLRAVIAEGGPGTGLPGLMPAWGQTLNARQVDFVVAYLRRMGRAPAPAPVPAP